MIYALHMLKRCQEGKSMRLSAGQGSAMLNCEGYTKDREEYDLDQDIERNMGGHEVRWLQIFDIRIRNLLMLVGSCLKILVLGSLNEFYDVV